MTSVVSVSAMYPVVSRVPGLSLLTRLCASFRRQCCDDHGWAALTGSCPLPFPLSHAFALVLFHDADSDLACRPIPPSYNSFRHIKRSWITAQEIARSFITHPRRTRCCRNPHSSLPRVLGMSANSTHRWWFHAEECAMRGWNGSPLISAAHT